MPFLKHSRQNQAHNRNSYKLLSVVSKKFIEDIELHDFWICRENGLKLEAPIRIWAETCANYGFFLHQASGRAPRQWLAPSLSFMALWLISCVDDLLTYITKWMTPMTAVAGTALSTVAVRAFASEHTEMFRPDRYHFPRATRICPSLLFFPRRLSLFDLFFPVGLSWPRHVLLVGLLVGFTPAALRRLPSYDEGPQQRSASA